MCRQAGGIAATNSNNEYPVGFLFQTTYGRCQFTFQNDSRARGKRHNLPKYDSEPANHMAVPRSESSTLLNDVYSHRIQDLPNLITRSIRCQPETHSPQTPFSRSLLHNYLLYRYQRSAVGVLTGSAAITLPLRAIKVEDVQDAGLLLVGRWGRHAD